MSLISGVPCVWLLVHSRGAGAVRTDFDTVCVYQSEPVGFTPR